MLQAFSESLIKMRDVRKNTFQYFRIRLGHGYVCELDVASFCRLFVWCVSEELHPLPTKSNIPPTFYV
jgi:hypothetical protein